jgi:hypothetical protein
MRTEDCVEPGPLLAAVLRLVLLLVPLASCATAPARRLDGRPRCDVSEAHGLFAKTVSVDRGIATSYGMSEDEVARIDRDGTIYSLGLFGRKVGAYVQGRLRIEGFFSDTVSEPISHGRVVIRGVIFDDDYVYTPTCDTAEAAVGVYALHVKRRQAAAAQQQSTARSR